MINEALEAVIELDMRVLYTLPKFLFLPGRLTKEYINGRRKRYIRPFRLYLFSTFLLFAVIALTTTGNFGFVLDPQGMARFNPPNTAIAASTAPDPDTTQQREASMFGDPERRKKMAQQIRSDSTSINVELYDDPEANENMERVLRTKVAQAIEDPWEAVNSAIDRGPYLMFLLLPIFAFLLKLLYIRRGRLYVEHLIFSLHVHAFAFFAFTAGLLLDQSSVGWLQATAPWVDASPLLYLVLAMSHVYEQGLIKSTIKSFILLLIYSLVFTIGFLALLFIAVLLM
jgi:nitrate reductase NapE component